MVCTRLKKNALIKHGKKREVKEGGDIVSDYGIKLRSMSKGKVQKLHNDYYKFYFNSKDEAFQWVCLYCLLSGISSPMKPRLSLSNNLEFV